MIVLNYFKYPKLILSFGYFFYFSTVFGQASSTNETANNAISILKRPSISLNIQSFFSKPHLCLQYGRIDDKKSLLKNSNSIGVGFYRPLKNLSGISIDLNYGILRSYYAYSYVYSDSILPSNYTEDFIWTRQDILQLNVHYRKYKMLKKYNYLVTEIGINLQRVLFQNDFVEGAFPTKDYKYYPLVYVQLINKRFFPLPAINASLGIGHIKRDTDLISLSLIANLSFFNLYQSTLTAFPTTAQESQLQINHRGSFVGLKATYSSTFNKLKK